MLAVELVIVLLAIFLGARLGGIGIGFAGGLGVLALALIGVKPGNIPFDVISIIMAVIAPISAMQDGRQRHSGAFVAAGGDLLLLLLLLLLLGAAVLAGRHGQGADADGAGAERVAADRRRLLRRRFRPVHPADLPDIGRRGADG